MRNMIFENVLITDAGSEGKAVARVNNQVVFVPFVVPGDIVDIKVVRKKKSFFEGVAIKIHKYSDKRTEAFCEHFGTCGGCKWQNMQYSEQLYYKQKQVDDQFKRIGHIENIEVLPILGSDKIKYYRNKLEYTFSNHRWLSENDMHDGGRLPENKMNALGFHIPALFDKVLDIRNCYLQPDPSNAIRLEAKRYAIENNLEFYDVRAWKGFLRNILIRNTLAGDLMVIVVFRNEDKAISGFMKNLQEKFPQITSLLYVINDKKNDIINDLPFTLFSGNPFITEKMPSLKGDKDIEYRIGPVSFFQTNSLQASELYKIAGRFAEFSGNETVYDLYTGIGSIANFISSSVNNVVGIEYVQAAIEDAKLNSAINGIKNTSFFAGEAEKLLNDDFFAKNGKPDVIITDPPRAGMHEKVVNAIIGSGAEKVVYISCNPATQARDIALMKDHFTPVKCQPVDMFPHTHHVENVALLKRK